MKESLWVELEDRRYPITIGSGISDELIVQRDRMIHSGTKGAVIVDEGVLLSNPEICRNIIGELPKLVVPSGESSKCQEYLVKIWNFLAENKIDRSGFLFALGGGVIGDLAGFAAATFLRGISFYQIPSTLLAMVDSSVGGKTGINLSSGKNLVGSFHQPKAVWADLNLLDTLPQREFSAGMAEVVKYGLLGDRDLYEQLLARKETLNSKSFDLVKIIRRCCENKAAIVEVDERETNSAEGGRALLNLGHTFAHAIESVSGYGTYLHGEAVSIGLLCAWRLSVELGELKEEEDEFINLMHLYDLPTSLSQPLKIDQLVRAMQSDKKVSHGKLRFVLMRNIGDAFQKEVESAHLIERVLISVGASE